MSRTAIVLFNLGGPDSLEAVKPFLFNLFRDPAIIGLPAIARYPIAALISTTREKTAKANYAIMGGGSPLLPETEKQARALEVELARTLPGVEAKCFIAMRYWNPLTGETAKQVKAFAPDEIVLLPLYPQFSATTTASSLGTASPVCHSGISGIGSVFRSPSSLRRRSAVRCPNTRPSSSELLASRLAPCRPVNEASPTQLSPGMVVRPFMSVVTPPHM